MGIEQTIVQPEGGASLHEMMLDLYLQSFVAWPLRYRSVIGGSAFADGRFHCRCLTRLWVSAVYSRTRDECDRDGQKRGGKKADPFELRSCRPPDILPGSILFPSPAGNSTDIRWNGAIPWTAGRRIGFLK